MIGGEAWGEMPQKEKTRRDEPLVDECNICPKYGTCTRPKDQDYYDRCCMNMGEGCDRMYSQTEEERRMEI